MGSVPVGFVESSYGLPPFLKRPNVEVFYDDFLVPCMITKKELRTLLTSKRNQFIVSELDSISFCKNVLSIVKKDDTVALYYPIKNEVDSLAIIKLLNINSIKTCIPYINKNNVMSFVEYSYGESISIGKFHIPIPKIIKPCNPNVIIAPLLGFDKYGNRLGYGSGFYDKTLYNLKNITYLGIAYSWQEVDEIPSEITDIKLNGIITNQYVKYF